MKISTAWPTEPQLTLLKAALLPPEKAEYYWRSFTNKNDLQKLDHGCTQVLPMTFINLKDHMDDDINKQICRSSYKYAWANNHLLTHDAKSLLLILKENNLDVCLLKGAAFITHYFPDYGMRIMGDIDLLATPRQMPELIRTLDANNYKLKSNHSDIDTQSLVKFFHGRSFMNERGTDFDIHQHLTIFLIDAEFNSRMWKNKTPIRLFNQDSLAFVLSPTHQLLHTILHGLQHAPVSSIRWIVDATNLLNNWETDIDWEELKSISSSHNLNLPLKQALPFLKDNMEAAIPSNVVSYFNNLAITKRDEAYYIRSSNHGLTNTIERIKKSWEHYRIYSGIHTKVINPVGFYKFLIVYLDIKSPWILPLYLMRKIFSTMSRSIKSPFNRA